MQFYMKKNEELEFPSTAGVKPTDSFPLTHPSHVRPTGVLSTRRRPNLLEALIRMGQQIICATEKQDVASVGG